MDKSLIKYDIFSWKGVNRSGENAKGKIRAEDMQKARILLDAQGIKINSIKKTPTLLLPARVQKKITQADITIFFRQLATMIAAGIPLVQGLEFVAIGSEKLKVSTMIMNLHRIVSAGNTLADAMKQYPKFFSELVRSLIQVGEQAGNLDTVLAQIATYLERIAILKGRIKKAMFYPVTMFVVMIVLAVLLLTFIVPKFEGMFKSFGADLPAPTQFVINLSATLQEYWWLFLCVFFIIVGSYFILKKRSDKFRHFTAKMSLHIIIFGTLFTKTAIARTTRTLAITLASGIPLVDALEAVSKVSGNLIYTEAIEKVREKVILGQQMSEAMAESPHLFPSMVVQMISVGEKSGSLEEMLIKIADFYDEEIDTTVDGLSTLIEPLMIIMLGVIIGGFVVSMYLPIFKIGTLV